MRAMILAAGFGTRLKKITEKTPKPLVRIGKGKRIIDTVIDNLLRANIKEIAVNLHYKAELIENYLKEKYESIIWKFFYEKEILGTGGGVLNAKSFFEKEDDFVLINSDILTFVDLKELIRIHRKSNALASLVVFENQKDPKPVFYDRKNGKIISFGKDKDFEIFIKGTFTGIHIVSGKIFNFMKDESGFFSIIAIYEKIIKAGKRVGAIEIDDYWKDVGTINSLKEGREDFRVFSFIENDLGEKILKVKRTFKGGSEKRVFRIETDGVSRIAVISNKEEIKSLNTLSRFFYDKKFPIPYIIKSDKKWLLTEDGGKKSLLDVVEEGRIKGFFPLELYKKAIDYLEELARVDVKLFPKDALFQRAYFDFENIIFDLKYFNKYYYKNRLSDSEIEKMAENIYSHLKKHPLSIMHRDYQSTNILINNNGELRVIDYQTMRIGFSVYDLASLILDSYIPFEKKTIEYLKDYFFSLETFKDYDKDVFWTAALIRVLQNLGAFGNLGRKSEFFKSKIPEAEKRLKFILKRVKIKFSMDIL